MQTWSKSSNQQRRILAIVVSALLLLSACAEDERREIRLTPTSTVETGVRVLVDNCPGPTAVTLLVRDEILWQVDSPTVNETAEEAQTDLESNTAETDAAPTSALPAPGLAEFLVGQAPEDWTTSTPLENPLQPGIRYTIQTSPDGQTVDFSTPDLAAGLLWDGRGNAQFNPNLINVECSAPADVGAFAQNLVVLLLLGITAAATAIVTIILILFVITRRFSRIRSLQNKARKQAGSTPDQRPRARSNS